ncbi:hypothetical protein B0H34DRAFT_808825 [Crassisporium funariophilum]|nr:hypothetical protein B0H34DRAFT_808825 [Crassisporium funariophilum]
MVSKVTFKPDQSYDIQSSTDSYKFTVSVCKNKIVDESLSISTPVHSAPHNPDIDSIFQSLLKSNSPPTPEESLKIENYRTQCLALVAGQGVSEQACDTLRSAIMIMLDERPLGVPAIPNKHPENPVIDMCRALGQKRYTIALAQQHVQSCDAILSQLRSIPAEIWIEIFLYCLPAIRKPDAKLAPMLLCQVCSAWRTTAFEDSRLWDTLVLPFKIKVKEPPTQAPTITPVSWPNRAKKLLGGSKSTSLAPPVTPVDPLFCLMNIWAERSKSRLISCTLEVIERDQYVADLDPAIMTAILHHSQRLRELSLSFFSKADLSALFNCADHGYFDNLEALTLKMGDFTVWSDSLFAWALAPQLRKVKLLVNSYNLAKIVLPWSQLTHVNLLSCPLAPAPLNVLLRKCEKLQEGAFSVLANRGTQNNHVEDPALVTLVDLRTLALQILDPETKCLRGLILPSLTTFHLGRYKTLNNWSIQWTGSDLVSHNLQNLRKLTLSNIYLPVDKFLTLFRMTSSLATLIVDMEYREDEWAAFIKGLVVHCNDTTLPCLPNLKSLTLCIKHIAFPSTGFVKMIASRCNVDVKSANISPIRNVWLRFLYDTELIYRLPQLLATYIEEGLVFSATDMSSGTSVVVPLALEW